MQSSNLHKPDASLATAIENAVKDFGMSVLNEQRLIGILKDFHGFETMPFAEHIIRTLIDRHFLIQLSSFCKKGKDDILADVCRESSILSKEYGYSEDKAKLTILSVLTGLGCKVFYQTPELARRTPDSFISIKSYSAPRKLPTNNQNSKTPNANTNQKPSFRFAFCFLLVVAFMVIGFCLLITLRQPNNDIKEPITEIQEAPLQPIKTKEQILDSIQREIDSTRKANGLSPIFYTSPKKGKAKGRYRERQETAYETAYEEGYEDGLNDQRFKSR